MAGHDTQALRTAARHMLQHPFTCCEQYPEMFSTIRRHEQQLDRWFTQRLGYRLHVSSFTARLFKNTVVPHRPVLSAPTSAQRAMSQRECTMLSLILAAVAAGPRIISLRDLVEDVRTAAADADIVLSNEPVERRAFIIALKWMIKAGMAAELHEHIDRYEHDANADAIVEIDPDRVSLLPLPALGRAESARTLLDRSDRRIQVRQWLRAQLAENTVVYRDDLEEHEWSQLRRRIGEEVSLFEQMFDLSVEARFEGVAAIDASGQLSDRKFPSTGTVGHAALVLVEWLLMQSEAAVSTHKAQAAFAEMADKHRKHWSQSRLAQMPAFFTDVVMLLQELRLVSTDDKAITVLPAAARYSLIETVGAAQGDNDEHESAVVTSRASRKDNHATGNQPASKQTASKNNGRSATDDSVRGGSNSDDGTNERQRSLW